MGGVKRIGAVTEKLVPAMSLLYIIGALAIIFANLGGVGSALKAIVIGAFNPESALGGAFGIGFGQAVRLGVGRGATGTDLPGELPRRRLRREPADRLGQRWSRRRARALDANRFHDSAHGSGGVVDHRPGTRP